MPFTGVINPAELAILIPALDDFCRIGDIKARTPEHEEAGVLIHSLYNKGATTAEALSAAVENALPNASAPHWRSWFAGASAR